MKGITLLLSVFISTVVFATDTIETHYKPLSRKDSINSLLDRIEGSAMVDLMPGVFKFEVKPGFYMLAGNDAKWVSKDLWENNGTENLLALLIPEKYSVTDAVLWAASIRYIDEGFVYDNDITELDTADYFKQVVQETEAQNEARKELGLSGMEFIGWADVPFYDSKNKVVYWPKEYVFEGREGHYVNVSIQQFCRGGFVNLNIVVPKSLFNEVKPNIPDLISSIHIAEGQRYADYDPKTDKKAAYVLGASVHNKKQAWKRSIFDNITNVLMLSNFIVLPIIFIIWYRKKNKAA